MQPAYTVVHTRWIGRDGRDQDLKARVGRLGDDVSVFALHTLGWIQIMEIARFLEIRFDPRATGPDAISSLDDLLFTLDRSETPWLVKMHVFNGKTWMETTDTDASRLSRFVHDCFSFCERPDVPSALRTEVLGDAVFQRIDDPLIRRISAAWRGKAGRIDQALMAEIGAGTYGNVKMLTLLDDNRLVFNHYRASITGPWDNDTWIGFSGRDVRQAVPDRALANAVDRSARQVLAGAAPMLEHWSGPILTSKGAAMYDWLRASFPVQHGNSHNRQGAGTVLVVCVPALAAYRATA